MNYFQLLIFSPRVSLFFNLQSVKCKTCFSWICALNSWMTRWSPCCTAMLASLDVFPPPRYFSALPFTAHMLILQGLVPRLPHELSLVPLLFTCFLALSHCGLISIPFPGAVWFPVSQMMSQYNLFQVPIPHFHLAAMLTPPGKLVAILSFTSYCQFHFWSQTRVFFSSCSK